MSPPPPGKAPPPSAVPSPAAASIKALPRQSTRYTLNVTLDLARGSYRGDQRIAFTNRNAQALNEVVLVLYPDAATPSSTSQAAHVAARSVRVNGVAARDVTRTGRLLKIGLTPPLPPGKTIDLGLDLEGQARRRPPRDDATATWNAIQGRLRSLQNDTFKSSPGMPIFTPSEQMTLGFWYPRIISHGVKARRLAKGTASPTVRFIEPADYEVRVAAPLGVTVVSSGVEVARSATKTKRIFRFQAKAARGVGLVAMGEAAQLSRQVGPVVVRSTFRSRDGAVGERILNLAVGALGFFQTSFGPYPFAELDMVQADLLAGASGVSFPGLVALSSAFYGPNARVGAHRQLLGGMMSRELLEETLEFVVAHEVAHAWWGAVVTHDRQLGAAFDEALAQHSAMLFMAHKRGEASARRQRVLQMQVGYRLSRLMGFPDIPLLSPRSAFESPFHKAAISYGKGGLFLDSMLRQARSKQAHTDALAAYYVAHRFGLGDPMALLTLFEASAKRPKELRAAAKRWLNGRYGDSDVGPLDVGALLSLVPQALRSDPALRGILSTLAGQDLGSASRLTKTLLDGDLPALLSVIKTSIPEDASSLKRMVERLQQVAEDPGLLSDSARAPAFLTAIARDLAGDDPQWGALIDAATGLLGSKPPRKTPKAPRPPGQSTGP